MVARGELTFPDGCLDAELASTSLIAENLHNQRHTR
jgi:hypothetical protein